MADRQRLLMSLRRSLIVSFSLVLTLLAMAAALVAYISAFLEASELLDLQQQQIARFVGDESSLAGLDPEAFDVDTEQDYLIEITYRDGRPTRRSDSAAVWPSVSSSGFSEFTSASGHWRMFTAITGQRTVKVAQLTTVRNELATSSAFYAALPSLLAIPLAWIIVQIIVGVTIRRLTRVADAVATRAPTDLEPLEIEPIPIEIRPLVVAMNNALARARTSVNQQRTFLSNAAHQLRTPLAALSLQIGNLTRITSDPGMAERGHDLEKGIRRAVGVTEQLLRLARQEAAESNGSFEAVELRGLVLAAVADLVPLAEAKNIDIGLIDSAPARIKGHSGDLLVMLAAILENAVQYSDVGGTIDVSISAGGSMVVLSILDAGPGIPEALHERVFERFFRADATDAPGSGLGLSIAKAIADRHGARIELANRADRSGLRISLSFNAL